MGDEGQTIWNLYKIRPRGRTGIAPLAKGTKGNGTDLRLVGTAHPTVYQDFQRSQSAYVSAIGTKGGNTEF
ncbi:MAG: hypothetical protein F6K30_17805 [Cyanothece sp. SIO2G6]|nr:hypothetical protein [Cyanothece sp. SIO2G6]